MINDDDIRYTTTGKKSVVQKIFSEVYGDAAPPEEVLPFSFITKSDLDIACTSLRLNSKHTFLDLACGTGGPGLWIAKKTRAKIIGIDHSFKAIEEAKIRVKEFGLDGNAEYTVGNAESIGIKSHCMDGVVSFDALWAPNDKIAVFNEIKRILRPTGILVFTTWEQRINYYQEIATETGFKIQSYYETANWENLQRSVYKRWIESEELLVNKMGRNAADLLIQEATFMTDHQDGECDRLSQVKRVFITAIT